MKKIKSIMQYVKSFYTEYIVLSKLSLLSLGFIVFYYLSYDVPELWKNASILVDILFQLSLAVVSSLIFYLFQVYIPDYKRKQTIQPIVRKKIRTIIEYMEIPFEEITSRYLQKSTLNLQFGDFLPQSTRSCTVNMLLIG